MKRINFLLISIFMVTSAIGQVPYNAAAPNGYTRKAIVSEQVGQTQIYITYHRPAVSGREGKIWGQTVHKGFVDLGFGARNPAPWRAGANENTVIEFDKDIRIEGQALPKGRYALFVAFDPLESTIIFSKRDDSWGSFFYNEKDDALRVKVKPLLLEKSVELLKYEFTGQTPNSAIVELSWEKMAIPFKIEVDHLKQQFDAFVAEMQNPRGFTSQGLNIAANWALQNNYELEKALEWSTLATAQNFPGDPTSFPAAMTKATILAKLGSTEEAEKVVKSLETTGNVSQLMQLGRQLLSVKNNKLAMEVFQFNYTKNPEHFISLVGMARGLSAEGNFSKALEFANKALPVAPNDQNKQAVQIMINKLKENMDIN